MDIGTQSQVSGGETCPVFFETVNVSSPCGSTWYDGMSYVLLPLNVILGVLELLSIVRFARHLKASYLQRDYQSPTGKYRFWVLIPIICKSIILAPHYFLGGPFFDPNFATQTGAYITCICPSIATYLVFAMLITTSVMLKHLFVVTSVNKAIKKLKRPKLIYYQFVLGGPVLAGYTVVSSLVVTGYLVNVAESFRLSVGVLIVPFIVLVVVVVHDCHTVMKQLNSALNSSLMNSTTQNSRPSRRSQFRKQMKSLRNLPSLKKLPSMPSIRTLPSVTVGSSALNSKGTNRVVQEPTGRWAESRRIQIMDEGEEDTTNDSDLNKTLEMVIVNDPTRSTDANVVRKTIRKVKFFRVMFLLSTIPGLSFFLLILSTDLVSNKIVFTTIYYLLFSCTIGVCHGIIVVYRKPTNKDHEIVTGMEDGNESSVTGGLSEV